MYKFFKRTFDLCASFLLLIVISPVFIVLMALVRFKLGSPIFFRELYILPSARRKLQALTPLAHFRICRDLYRRTRSATARVEIKGAKRKNSVCLLPYPSWLRVLSVSYKISGAE